ncbi:hypothetical protein TZ53_02230 [Sphingobium sp. YBL2]|nr:hypothetical protein TZ53_02230 [Sphingobium sp. YBL2]
MMAAQGLDIDRSTLAGWAAQAAHPLDPIVSRIREEGIKDFTGLLQADAYAGFDKLYNGIEPQGKLPVRAAAQAASR